MCQCLSMRNTGNQVEEAQHLEKGPGEASHMHASNRSFGHTCQNARGSRHRGSAPLAAPRTASAPTRRSRPTHADC